MAENNKDTTADALVNFMSEIAQNVSSSGDISAIKVANARVVSYDDDTYKAVVKFIDDSTDDEKNQYTFYNNTGSRLEPNDIVCIYYTINRAKGKMICKNGEPSPLSSGGGVGIAGTGENSEIHNGLTSNKTEGDYSFTTGYSNEILEEDGDSLSSAIIGGYSNTITDGRGIILGGTNNEISEAGTFAFVAGIDNTVSGARGIVLGDGNTLNNSDSSFSIVLGNDNTIDGYGGCIIAGGSDNTITNTSGSSVNSSGIFCGRDNHLTKPINSAIVCGYNNSIAPSSQGYGSQMYSIICNGNGNSITDGNGDFIGSGFSLSISGSSQSNAITNGYLNTIVSGMDNTICGGNNNAINSTNNSCITAGNNNTITSSQLSTICGGSNNTISSANSAILNGYNNKIESYSHSYSSILNGQGNRTGNASEVVCGTYNVVSASTDNNRLVVGSGTSDTARSNAFRVASTGDVYAGNSINATGADFAEMREWSDGNTINQDRRGLFVVYDNTITYSTGEDAKIRIANENDYLDEIIGIVSSTPTVVGNTASETWGGMWVKDIFGNVIIEEVEIPEETEERTNPDTNETETIVIRPAHTEMQPKVNPDYDNTKPYVNRENRKEWAKIGMLGMIVTVDDGTCQMLKYCKVGANGVATHSNTKTRFRVVSRLDDTHIKVEIK